MKKIIFCLTLIFVTGTVCACGSAAKLFSVSSSIADQVITGVKSLTASDDPDGTNDDSADPSVPSDTSEEADNTGASEDLPSDPTADSSDISSSDKDNSCGSDSPVSSLKKLLKSGTATIGDLKAVNLSSLKASPALLLDLFTNAGIEKNPYSNRLFRHEGSLLYYDDPEYDCLLGIDVSFFQGEIDWEAVKAQGISFVFVRIGFRGYGEEGTLNEDALFRQNLEGAAQAGLLVGAYFFSQAVNEEEAAEEAEYALSLLDGTSLDLPLVFDAEYIKEDDTRLDDVLLTQFTKNALAFFHTVEAAGYKAMLYTNLLWEGLIYDLGALSDYPVWYADYNPMPLTPYRFDFWQYTESGRIDGIDEPVDLNIWMKPTSP